MPFRYDCTIVPNLVYYLGFRFGGTYVVELGCNIQGSRIMGTSKFRTKSVRNYTSVPVIVEYTENMLEIKLEKYIRT